MSSLPSSALAETLSFFDFQPAPGVVEFLEKNIEVPERVSPNQPGRFSTLQRPYMREPLECFQSGAGVVGDTFGEFRALMVIYSLDAFD